MNALAIENEPTSRTSELQFFNPRDQLSKQPNLRGRHMERSRASPTRCGRREEAGQSLGSKT